jgi:uncharacterized DUF497 family protein
MIEDNRAGSWLPVGQRQPQQVPAARRIGGRNRRALYTCSSRRPDLEHSHAESRYLAIGQAADRRHVFPAFTLREQDRQRLIRPISARYMHTQEVRHYEAQIAKLDQ